MNTLQSTQQTTHFVQFVSHSSTDFESHQNLAANVDNQNTEHTHGGHNLLDTSATTAEAVGHSTVAHADHPVDEQKELLGGLTDHYGFVWSNFHLFDLPFIIYDDGLHFHASEKSLNESGKFIIEEHAGHKTVKKVDGTEPEFDLSITNFVMFQFIVMIALVGVFFKVKAGYKSKDKAPTGLQNAVEILVLFVRDEIVRPNLPSIKISDALTPYFIVLFFFIAGLNYVGMFPGAHTPTSALEVTGAFALTAFFVINFYSIKMSGIGNYMHHLLGGAPWWMAVIMVPIEILSLFIKPLVLTLRLFANMTAGHLVITALIAVIIVSKNALVGIPIVPFTLFITLLEILVSFIQAFVFVMLTAIFTGLAIGDHPKKEWLDAGQTVHSH